MFFAALYMQSVCRCCVSRASAVLQWNIKVPSSVATGLASAALLLCCFSTWDNSCCTSQIKANPDVYCVEYRRAPGVPVEENAYLNKSAACGNGGIVASVQLHSLRRNTYSGFCSRIPPPRRRRRPLAWSTDNNCITMHIKNCEKLECCNTEMVLMVCALHSSAAFAGPSFSILVCARLF